VLGVDAPLAAAEAGFGAARLQLLENVAHQRPSPKLRRTGTKSGVGMVSPSPAG
jgi:hypothetical protein